MELSPDLLINPLVATCTVRRGGVVPTGKQRRRLRHGRRCDAHLLQVFRRGRLLVQEPLREISPQKEVVTLDMMNVAMRASFLSAMFQRINDSKDDTDFENPAAVYTAEFPGIMGKGRSCSRLLVM